MQHHVFCSNIGGERSSRARVCVCACVCTCMCCVLCVVRVEGGLVSTAFQLYLPQDHTAHPCFMHTHCLLGSVKADVYLKRQCACTYTEYACVCGSIAITFDQEKKEEIQYTCTVHTLTIRNLQDSTLASDANNRREPTRPQAAITSFQRAEHGKTV